MMNIIETMTDRKLFKKTFRPGMFGQDSWRAWKAFLSALFGLPMDGEMQAVYQKHTGRTDIPAKQFREAYLVAGRRSGKSIIAALVAVFVAVFRNYDEMLSPGEVGVVMVLASDRRQARTIFNYIAAFLEAPLLKSMVVTKLKESIELRNRIRIEIHTSSYKSVRGFTIVAAIADEVAFWQDESSSNPDVEIFSALRPAMATIPDALLIGISSPYARRGVLFTAHREHFGKSGSDVLVWQADSASMNPTLSRTVIEAAYVKDASSARAEYGAQFRDDVEGFVSIEMLESRMIPGRRELPFDPTKTYYGFTDPSGGVSDSFTMGIAHCERDRAVLDVLREAQSPLSPKEVTAEFAALFRAYRVSEVEGDRYAGEWPREEFGKHGVSYKVSEKNKSELYLELLPALMSGSVELLDHSKMVAQLTGLERRTGRGRDSIDHAPGSHDDVANAAAGALGLVLTWNVIGQLGVIEVLKRKAKGIAAGVLWWDGTRKAEAPAPGPIPLEPGKPVEAHSPPKREPNTPCLARDCGSLSTVWRSDGNGRPLLHCNQCGRDDGQDRSESLGCEPGCPGFLKQFAGCRVKCGNCGGHHDAARTAIGMSRAQYAARGEVFGRDRYGSFG